MDLFILFFLKIVCGDLHKSSKNKPRVTNTTLEMFMGTVEHLESSAGLPDSFWYFLCGPEDLARNANLTSLF